MLKYGYGKIKNTSNNKGNYIKTECMCFDPENIKRFMITLKSLKKGITKIFCAYVSKIKALMFLKGCINTGIK